MWVPALLPIASCAQALVLPQGGSSGTNQIVLNLASPPEQTTSATASLSASPTTASKSHWLAAASPTLEDHAEYTTYKFNTPTADDEFEDHRAEWENDLHAMLEEMELSISSPDAALGDFSRLTVYEAIAALDDTAKFTSTINLFPDLITQLNDSSEQLTVFAPTNDAFSKHFALSSMDPSSWKAREILRYHISPYQRPLRELLSMTNIPTLLLHPMLNGPQVLRLRASIYGVAINDHAHIIQSDIVCANGILHIVSAVAQPPRALVETITQRSTDLSTFALAMRKTGLLADLTQGYDVDFAQRGGHIGATIFAPANHAFTKLGPGLNDFLFSNKGQKYLRALLEYHVVLNDTLYSNLHWRPDSPAESESDTLMTPFIFPPSQPAPEKLSASPINPTSHITKDGFVIGHRHQTLKSMLPGHSLNVGVSRIGSAIVMQPQPGSTIVTADRLASDGVLHIVDNILVPPRKDAAKRVYWHDPEAELSVDELVWRLDGFVKEE